MDRRHLETFAEQGRLPLVLSIDDLLGDPRDPPGWAPGSDLPRPLRAWLNPAAVPTASLLLGLVAVYVQTAARNDPRGPAGEQRRRSLREKPRRFRRPAPGAPLVTTSARGPARLPAILAITVALVAVVARAEDESGTSRADAASETGGSHHKGSKELAVITGLGVSHALWDGVTDARFLSLGARLGKVVSRPRGPGFLRGNLEVAVELLPVFLTDVGGTSYGASFTLLGRHFFRPSSAIRPYAVLGAGALLTSHSIPEDSSRLNFTPQAGLGVSFTHGDRAFYVEYHIHHISAGHRTPAGNPGINSSYLQFSVSLYRW